MRATIKPLMQSLLRLAGDGGYLQASKQFDMAWIALDAGLASPVKPSGYVNCRSFRLMHRSHASIFAGYFFISIMNRAMSWASLRVKGGFGIVACGRSRNEAITSAVIFSLAAIDANDRALWNLPDADPIA
jgi:hypothetical protein